MPRSFYVLYMKKTRPQPQKRDNSEPDPPQIDRYDSLSTIITPETEFDTEQSHTYNRECSKELPSITGDSNSIRGEKQPVARAICSKIAANSRQKKKRLKINATINHEIKRPNNFLLVVEDIMLPLKSLTYINAFTRFLAPVTHLRISTPTHTSEHTRVAFIGPYAGLSSLRSLIAFCNRDLVH
ncbi:hypothetical protein ACTXT7_015529 [Hymenolepis weldensis]